MKTSRPALPSTYRRRLLQAMAAGGMIAAIDRNRALAQAAPDYKALVRLSAGRQRRREHARPL
ncbi:MAG: hypothetical protein IPF73_06080 [Betaproteobacteria bacterium]|nr:hypothetical protein [Betaproteobacteria bacterium]